MSDRLNVYLRTEKVGRLWLDDGRRFYFQYAPEWLASENAIPLSLRLPLQSELFDDEKASPFFANLLPESELRRMVAQKLGLSEKNDFALLEAVGGECAGAVSLLPDEIEPTGEGSYRALDDDALNSLIDELPMRPMLAGEEGIRLSLAGAQNKLPVYYDGEQVSLPIGMAPSSHILKPPIQRYPDSVHNEAFCMQLAQRVGLSVPATRILQKVQPLYLVERYDRLRMSDETFERVHQEDFCQALGIPPEQKYEKEGGPSLQQCFSLLREASVLPVADVKALLHWVVFNFFIGNADAHGKNISLLLTQEGPILAPFYDLMSTAVYPELAQRYAMRIGGEDRPDWIIERRWQAFAEEVDIGYKLVRQTLLEMKEQVSEEATALAGDFAKEYGKSEVIEKILAVIEKHRTKITNMLAAGDKR